MKLAQEAERRSDQRTQTLHTPDGHGRKMLGKRLLELLTHNGIEEGVFVWKMGVSSIITHIPQKG